MTNIPPNINRHFHDTSEANKENLPLWLNVFQEPVWERERAAAETARLVAAYREEHEPPTHREVVEAADLTDRVTEMGVMGRGALVGRSSSSQLRTGGRRRNDGLMFEIHQDPSPPKEATRRQMPAFQPLTELYIVPRRGHNRALSFPGVYVGTQTPVIGSGASRLPFVQLGGLEVVGRTEMAVKNGVRRGRSRSLTLPPTQPFSYQDPGPRTPVTSRPNTRAPRVTRARPATSRTGSSGSNMVRDFGPPPIMGDLRNPRATGGNIPRSPGMANLAITPVREIPGYYTAPLTFTPGLGGPMRRSPRHEDLGLILRPSPPSSVGRRM